jgi:hypothetical protein
MARPRVVNPSVPSMVCTHMAFNSTGQCTEGPQEKGSIKLQAGRSHKESGAIICNACPHVQVAACNCNGKVCMPQ